MESVGVALWIWCAPRIARKLPSSVVEIEVMSVIGVIAYTAKAASNRRAPTKSAPRGRRFRGDAERIRRAFRRKGAGWGKPSWDLKAAEDQTRSGRVAWWRGPVR